MLWYKAWLETRWRFGFTLLCTLALMTLPIAYKAPAKAVWIGYQLQTSLLGAFAAIYAAGSGVNAQTFYGATSGFHGSMYFTLSLPVSHMRLLLTRAAMGAAQMAILVAVMAAQALYFHPPQPLTVAQVALYGVRAIVCSLAIYALAVLLSCLLDEMWMFWVCCLIVGFLWPLQFQQNWLGWLNPLRGLGLMALPITAPLPWATMLASVAIAALLLAASARILQSREF